jgi:carbonic anhydrase
LFVVRNVANLVPVFQPDGGAHGVSAALEYAVQVLRIKHIVVLGHAQCGGIRAFIDDIDPLSPGDFIGRWMAMFIKPGERSASASTRHGRISPRGSRRPRCSAASKT